jgi:hypothetical protein
MIHRRERGERRGKVYDLGRHKSIGWDISHMPSASLGHNASLSFVVIGRSEIINSGSWIL